MIAYEVVINIASAENNNLFINAVQSLIIVFISTFCDVAPVFIIMYYFLVIA